MIKGDRAQEMVRRIPEGQEPQWAALFEWMVGAGLIRSTELRARRLDALARLPQGYAVIGGSVTDPRPHPKKFVAFLLDERLISSLQLRRMGLSRWSPPTDPEILRQLIEQHRRSTRK